MRPDPFFVSVVIPTRDRPQAIGDCVRALCGQTFPGHRFEILIVDDGSAVPLDLSVLTSHCRTTSNNGPLIRLISQKNAGPAAARNSGVQQASGSLVALIDDDCLPCPDWLEKLVDASAKFPDAMVGGSTWNGLNEQFCAEVSQLIVTMAYDYFNVHPENAVFLASNNWLCSRQRYLELGGFDSTFRRPGAEDRDFCDRWRAAGLQIVLIPDARIEHRHAQNLLRFVQLHYRYGAGARIYHHRRSQRGAATMHQDLGFHRQLPRILPKYMRNYPRMSQRVYLIALLLIWEFANACGFLDQAIRDSQMAGWLKRFAKVS